MTSTSNFHTLTIDAPFDLECGASLPSLTIGYHTWGTLHANADNVVWICHALTGNSDAVTWWDGLIGEGRLFDPRTHFIVCANMLGSCYGTTGPSGPDFPLITMRDMVTAHIALRVALGIERIACLLGGSMGGQQVLEWALMEPDRIAAIVPIATNAKHSAWGIAFNAAQRMAIEADPTFGSTGREAGRQGLAAARAIGMISYRTSQLYNARQTDDNERLADFSAESYQRYQGKKLVDRFSAHSYWTLSRAMDSHDVGRGRNGQGNALRSITARTLSIGIDTDLLFPEHEQHFIADMVPRAQYRRMRSLAGHDAFLLDQRQLATIIHNESILR